MKLEFSRQIVEKSITVKFNRSPSVGVELFHANRHGRTDGRKDMTKLIVAFRNFANVPKKQMLEVLPLDQPQQFKVVIFSVPQVLFTASTLFNFFLIF
jgi:hypothetical protein